jgi:hypothetical protein
MKFKVLIEDNKVLQVYVGYEGSGDPRDEHKQIGVQIVYKKPTGCTGHSCGEVDNLPIQKM